MMAVEHLAIRALTGVAMEDWRSISPRSAIDAAARVEDSIFKEIMD